MLAERAFYCLGGQPAILAGCPCFARKLFPKEVSVKNKRDRLFFTQLFVPQASQSSYYRRTELEVLLAIPSAQSACGMEIFMTYGIFVWQAGEKSESRERQDAL